MQRWFWWQRLALAAGCYSPKLKNFGFSCDSSAAKPCPDGYFCNSGFATTARAARRRPAPAATATPTWRCRAAAPAAGRRRLGRLAARRRRWHRTSDMARRHARHGAVDPRHGQAAAGHGRRLELRPRRVHDRRQADKSCSACATAVCNERLGLLHQHPSGTRSASAKSPISAPRRPAPDFFRDEDPPLVS